MFRRPAFEVKRAIVVRGYRPRSHLWPRLLRNRPKTVGAVCSHFTNQGPTVLWLPLLTPKQPFRHTSKKSGCLPFSLLFQKEGWVTHGDFGFACSSPGDASLVQAEVIVPLIGKAPSEEADEETLKKWAEAKKLIPRIRRAWTTSHHIASDDASRLSCQDPDPIVRLHPAEREQKAFGP